MAGGAWRGIAGGVLSLVVLQALVDKNNTTNVGGLFTTLADLTSRALDPGVAAIPDHSTAAPAPTPTLGPDGTPNGGALTPDGRYLPPTDSTLPQPGGTPVVPDSYIPLVPPAPRPLYA